MRWMYHHTESPEGRIIRDEAEDARLVSEGWVDTPAKFPPARYIPTFDEVVAAGYSPEVAPRIIAREQALSDCKSDDEVVARYEAMARAEADAALAADSGKTMSPAAPIVAEVTPVDEVLYDLPTDPRPMPAPEPKPSRRQRGRRNEPK